MGRKRGGGSSSGGASSSMFGRKAAPAPSARPAAPAPAPVAAARPAPPPPAAHPQQQHQPMMAPPAASAPAPSGGGGMLSGLGGMMAQGVALGAGSAVGHKMVDGVAGWFSGGSEAAPQQAAPQTVQQQYTSSAQPVINSGDACAVTQKDLYQCLQEQNNNAAACQFYFDALRQCQENTSLSQFS